MKRITSLIKEILVKSTDISIERTRKLKLTFLVSIVSKGLSFLVLIISVPLTLNYLGPEKFGLVNTLISTFAVLNYADLGLGMGIQNTLPSLIFSDEKNDIKRYISSVFIFLLCVSAILIIINYLFLNQVNWLKFFNVKGQNNTEIIFSIQIFIGILSLIIPFSIIQRIQNAYQVGYISEIWISIGNLFSLVFLSCVILFKGDIPFILIAMQGSVLLFYIFNFYYSFYYKKIYTQPSIEYFDFGILKTIIKLGLIYLFIQVCSLFVNSIDNLIIAKVYGHEKVAEFTIAYRVLTFLVMPIQIFSIPLLSAYNDAWARKDKDWINSITYKLIKFGFFGSVICMFLFFVFGNTIIKYWTGTPALSNYQLSMFTLMLLYMIVNTIISMIALSKRFLNFLVWVYPIATISTIIFKYLMFKYFTIDYSSIVLGTVIPMTFLFFLPFLFKIYKEDFNS